MTDIRIIYSQPDWLLAYKPEGVSFHTEGEVLGFVECLRAQLNTREIWPIHRLDKPTSGIILFAKTAEAASVLSQMFANRQVEKYYLAISSSKPSKKQGWVIGDMEKSRRGAFKLCPSKNNPAITQFFSVSAGEGERLCLLRPLTGKTHQLRVALKSLSAPILGDAMYGGSSSDRMYLHAYAMRFTYQGDAFEFAEAPENSGAYSRPVVINQIQEWARPWQLKWPDSAKYR